MDKVSLPPDIDLAKLMQQSKAYGFSLPPGYFVRGYGRLLSDPETPHMFVLYGPDYYPVSTTATSRDEIEMAAWVDYRRRSLKILEGSGQGYSTPMPKGYGLFEHCAMFVLARPDGSTVCDFPLSVTRDRYHRTAWKDYRRQTLRVIADSHEREEL